MNSVAVSATVFGEHVEFEVARDGTTVLEAARAAGIELPSMCEAGSCSTCRARLLTGDVHMLNNIALDDDELAAGYVLACQSVPNSDAITLDFDQEP